MVTTDEEKAELRNSFFSSVSSNSQMGYLEDEQPPELAHRAGEQTRPPAVPEEFVSEFAAEPLRH